MSAPRHLWSGNWRLDSATVAEELAGRRAKTEEPAEVRPELPSPRPRSSVGAGAVAWLRAVRDRVGHRIARARRAPRAGRSSTVRAGRRRQLRAALLAAFVGLLSAGVAFAAVSLIVGSGGQSPALASGAPAWLGIDMFSFPVGGGSFPPGGGVVISDVVPGSPAAEAGLEPGDVITQIDNQPVASPSAVESAIAGMRVGDKVAIQYDRGPMTYTTQAMLQARPSGYP